MGLYDIKPEDMINASERFRVPAKREPVVDEPVSKAVGRKVFLNDRKVTEYIVKYKGNKPMDSTKPDNLMKDPEFIKGLKKELG